MISSLAKKSGCVPTGPGAGAVEVGETPRRHSDTGAAATPGRGGGGEEAAGAVPHTPLRRGTPALKASRMQQHPYAGGWGTGVQGYRGEGLSD